MHGYRFYEEFVDEQRSLSAGNVIAIEVEGGPFVQDGGVAFHALCAVTDGAGPNSPVHARLCNAEYLGARCRRVTEDDARRIHPRLFEVLDTLA